MDQHTTDTAVGTIAADGRSKRKRDRKEAKCERKKRRKEEKRKRKKLKLCPDGVKSSAEATIDAAESNSNLARKGQRANKLIFSQQVGGEAHLKYHAMTLHFRAV